MATLLETEVTGAKEAVVHLRNYAARIEHFAELWPDIIDAFTARESLWFGSAGGGTWQPLSPTYAAWKAVHFPGKPILVRGGEGSEDLKGSLTEPDRAKIFASDHMLILGSDVSYARYHTEKRPPLIPKIRLEAAIARLLDLWVEYKPGGWGQRLR